MTAPRNDSGDVRERAERDARFFAWDVPADAHIVALVYEAEDAERSATVVDAIATSIARRREHTLLLSTEPGPSPLDELLGGSNSEGLPAALAGRARLTDVAVQRVDRPFVYLPAGKDPAAVQALLEDEVLASFVGRVRERGGTLFLVCSDRTVLSGGLRSLVDGYVALGEADAPEGAENLTVFGRVRFGEADDGEPDGGGPEDRETEASSTTGDSAVVTDPDERPTEPAAPGESAPGAGQQAPDAPPPDAGAWGRHRAGPRLPALRIVAGAVGVVALFGGWWWFAGSTDEDAAGAQPTTVALAQAAIEPALPSLDLSEIGRLLESTPELPFSVLIASYADRADADERLGELTQAGSASAGLYFIAPTPVRGTIYHRVFAGALADRAEADALMQRLVADGTKGEASAWDLRPARLAFDLGIFLDRVEADARVSDLAAGGVPFYVLTATLDGQTVFHVYGGAYENERAALPMAELLEGAGESASLITRQGGVGSSSSP